MLDGWLGAVIYHISAGHAARRIAAYGRAVTGRKYAAAHFHQRQHHHLVPLAFQTFARHDTRQQVFSATAILHLVLEDEIEALGPGVARKNRAIDARPPRHHQQDIADRTGRDLLTGRGALAVVGHDAVWCAWAKQNKRRPEIDQAKKPMRSGLSKNTPSSPSNAAPGSYQAYGISLRSKDGVAHDAGQNIFISW